MSDPEKIKQQQAKDDAFIEAYKKLCTEHKLFITSCGCCGCWVAETGDGLKGLATQLENL